MLLRNNGLKYCHACLTINERNMAACMDMCNSQPFLYIIQSTKCPVANGAPSASFSGQCAAYRSLSKLGDTQTNPLKLYTSAEEETTILYKMG